MRGLLRALIVSGLVLGAANVVLANCDTDDPDGSKRATARANIAMSCDCASATNHGDYVSCVASHTNDEITNGLPKSCKGAVKKCAARSTCGKPGAVTCCVTKNGKTKCKIKKDATKCADAGECVGNYASCCDACNASGCVPTTTTTSTLLPTTSLPPTTIPGP